MITTSLEEKIALEIAKELVLKAIDNTTWAEDEYPGLKEKLRKAVEEDWDDANKTVRNCL